jgi:hypothetical protein
LSLIRFVPCHSNFIMSSHPDVIAADNDAHDAHDARQDRNSNPGLRIALDLRGALAAHDDDADTASQHSISFSSSSAASTHDSPKASEFVINDASHRRSNPHTTSTESSEDPDDGSLFNGHASSVTSHGEHSLDEYAKQVPPTPLTAALRNNMYPPSSPARSSVASLATSNSSYSRKARPESLLVDSSNGPLILGIALVDFNHQVRCYDQRGAHSSLPRHRLDHGYNFLLGVSLRTRRLTKFFRFWPFLMEHILYVNQAAPP